MRTLLMACATGAALVIAGATLAGPARAMPLAPAAAPSPRVDNVAHFCHREWRCSPSGGCGAVRTCGWWRDADEDVFVFVRPNHGWYRFYREPAYHPWTYRTDGHRDWDWIW